MSWSWISSGCKTSRLGGPINPWSLGGCLINLVLGGCLINPWSWEFVYQ